MITFFPDEQGDFISYVQATVFFKFIYLYCIESINLHTSFFIMRLTIPNSRKFSSEPWLLTLVSIFF